MIPNWDEKYWICYVITIGLNKKTKIDEEKKLLYNQKKKKKKETFLNSKKTRDSIIQSNELKVINLSTIRNWRQS